MQQINQIFTPCLEFGAFFNSKKQDYYEKAILV